MAIIQMEDRNQDLSICLIDQVQSFFIENLEKNLSFYRYYLAQALYHQIILAKEYYKLIGLLKVFINYFEGI